VNFIHTCNMGLDWNISSSSSSSSEEEEEEDIMTSLVLASCKLKIGLNVHSIEIRIQVGRLFEIDLPFTCEFTFFLCTTVICNLKLLSFLSNRLTSRPPSHHHHHHHCVRFRLSIEIRRLFLLSNTCEVAFFNKYTIYNMYIKYHMYIGHVSYTHLQYVYITLRTSEFTLLSNLICSFFLNINYISGFGCNLFKTERKVFYIRNE
jgi:hypothetical protein